MACVQVSDLKLKGPSFDALSALSEALGPGFVATMLHKKAAVSSAWMENSRSLRVIGRCCGALLCDVQGAPAWPTACSCHCKQQVHKNPKVLSEVLNWIAQAVEEFGLGSFNVKVGTTWWGQVHAF